MDDSEKEELEEYFQLIKQRYGIEAPVELTIEEEGGREGYYRATSSLPGEVVVAGDVSLKEAKRTVKHELAHAKLHYSAGPSDLSYEDARDLIVKELEAEVLERGKVLPNTPYLLMSHLVWRFGLSKDEAYSTVAGTLESLDLPVSKKDLYKARSSLERLPEEYFEARREENPEKLLE